MRLMTTSALRSKCRDRPLVKHAVQQATYSAQWRIVRCRLSGENFGLGLSDLGRQDFACCIGSKRHKSGVPI